MAYEDNDNFLKELLRDFKIEAAEHHSSIIEGLLELEKNSNSADYASIVERIFRETHSLKGAARAVNLPQIEKICMSLESLFNRIKKGELKINPGIFEISHKALDAISFLLKNIENPSASAAINFSILTGSIDAVAASQMRESAPQIAIADIESVNSDKSIESDNRNRSKQDGTIRISQKKLEQLMVKSDEMISLKTRLNFFASQFRELSPEFEKFSKEFSKMVDELSFDLKSSMLLPISSLTNLLPKIARDIATENGKEIDLVISGEGIEIDRKVMEELKDPMIHIIRNCCDHGIELPSVRRSAGKKNRGTIKITIEQESNRNISLTISDDGAGIDVVKLKESALKTGNFTPVELSKMDDKEAIRLIFESGISTKKFITDLSGRGLGMSIVLEKTEKLGGTVNVTTEKGIGTKFTFILPQTVAAFRGLTITSGNNKFVIQSKSVEKVLRIRPKEIFSVEAKRVISYDGDTVPIVPLASLLGIKEKTSGPNSEFINLMVVNISDRRVAFSADNIGEETEGIIKDLGPMLSKVRLISGAILSGSGSVLPILNTKELINEGLKFRTRDNSIIKESGSAQEQKRVIIAEDSVTIRSMLRGYVENAGYYVQTAVDGAQAFKMLQEESFDLLVSDIEMPNMNGFELTKRVREDSALYDMPVILVTALESKDDKERGLESGANAYIIKSTFEQSNLLDTIKRLI